MSIFTRSGFDSFASGLAATELADQWNSRLARIGGKIYALQTGPDANEGNTALTFKCPREAFEILTQIEMVVQAPYFARGQWVRVSADSPVEEQELRERIIRSYELVREGLSRRLQAELGLLS